jgi:hypothetical protein
MPVAARAERRQAFLMISVVAVVLGSGLTGAGLGGLENLRLQDAETTSVSAHIVLPITTDSPIAVGDHLSVEPACPQAHAHLSPRDSPNLAGIDEDPRGYLQAMAALRTHRPGEQVARYDPYQASLNPAVYLMRKDSPS